MQCTPQEIAEDTKKLLVAAGPLEQVGVCCINMDYSTPDENFFAMFEVIQHYRRYGVAAYRSHPKVDLNADMWHSVKSTPIKWLDKNEHTLGTF